MGIGLAACGLSRGRYDHTMLVLNLSCVHDHPFEGWFGSAEDFDDQLARGLISCPSCGETGIERRPSAPRLNVSHLRGPAPPRPKLGPKPSHQPAPRRPRRRPP